jgi:hypothetical protein
MYLPVAEMEIALSARSYPPETYSVVMSAQSGQGKWRYDAI